MFEECIKSSLFYIYWFSKSIKLSKNHLLYSTPTNSSTSSTANSTRRHSCPWRTFDFWRPKMCHVKGFVVNQSIDQSITSVVPHQHRVKFDNRLPHSTNGLPSECRNRLSKLSLYQLLPLMTKRWIFVRFWESNPHWKIMSGALDHSTNETCLTIGRHTDR